VETYLEEALKLAAAIAARASVAVKAAKDAVNEAFESSLEDGIEHERQTFYALFDTADQKEGMSAFLEKRKAEWQGK
ncbi:MAG: enoyl-CoA hydratase-related protein, partial [Anaerolineae bacterium]|nr:enoyl-CoA hydratase-related protein [Anaerolineae bacterium]